jgi:hypothetical protein
MAERLVPIPEWLAPAFQQFPIVAFVFLAAWLVIKWTSRWHQAELERESRRTAEAEARHRAELERVEARNRREVENLGAEIVRLRGRITRLDQTRKREE